MSPGRKGMVGFPSGQRDQTVNLAAQPSKVRILLPPLEHNLKNACRWQAFFKARGSSSVGRASAFQAEGREFEPRLPLDMKRLGYRSVVVRSGE